MNVESVVARKIDADRIPSYSQVRLEKCEQFFQLLLGGINAF